MERHFILTLGRSGSNALVDVINQHPQALNYGELLGDWMQIRKIRDRLGLWRGDDAGYLDALLADGVPLRVVNTLRNLRKRRAGKGREVQRRIDLHTIGAKDFATFFRAPDLRRYFLDRPDLKVIGLYRADTIARFVSWQLLDQTGTVKRALNDTSGPARITLDTTTLLADITRVAEESALLETMLSELPEDQVTRVCYEEFFFDAQAQKATIKTLYAFLGLPDAPANIRARKINTARLRDTVLNYDDCLNALAGSRFYDGFLAAG